MEQVYKKYSFLLYQFISYHEILNLQKLRTAKDSITVGVDVDMDDGRVHQFEDFWIQT
jgi:hypothetical protein